MSVDLHCKVRDVLASVRLSSDIKLTSLILPKLVEERNQCLHVVGCGRCVIIVEGSIVIVRVSNCSGGFDKQQIR